MITHQQRDPQERAEEEELLEEALLGASVRSDDERVALHPAGPVRALHDVDIHRGLAAILAHQPLAGAGEEGAQVEVDGHPPLEGGRGAALQLPGHELEEQAGRDAPGEPAEAR